jgi:hypothetical protein
MARAGSAYWGGERHGTGTAERRPEVRTVPRRKHLGVMDERSAWKNDGAGARHGQVGGSGRCLRPRNDAEQNATPTRSLVSDF